jgi:hypothetical protein
MKLRLARLTTLSVIVHHWQAGAALPGAHREGVPVQLNQLEEPDDYFVSGDFTSKDSGVKVIDLTHGTLSPPGGARQHSLFRWETSNPDWRPFVEKCPNRSGTAVLAVQNFVTHNVWHAISAIHGVWHTFNQVDDVKTIVVGGKMECKDELQDTLPFMLKDMFPGATMRRLREGQEECFAKIAWMYTNTAFWPGVFWEVAHAPSEAALIGFNQSFQQFHKEVMSALQLPAPGNKLCYMSRNQAGNKRGPGSRRRFSIGVDAEIQAIPRVTTLQLNCSIPLKTQLLLVRKCGAMFGIHGAGLMHEIFMRPGSHVLEFGADYDHKNNVKGDIGCHGYYGNMAKLMGHTYECMMPQESVTQYMMDGSDIVKKVTAIADSKSSDGTYRYSA